MWANNYKTKIYPGVSRGVYNLHNNKVFDLLHTSKSKWLWNLNKGPNQLFTAEKDQCMLIQNYKYNSLYCVVIKSYTIKLFRGLSFRT